MTRRFAGHGTLSVPCLVLLALLLPVAALGQYDSPPPPSAWALQDVTVVHGDGSRQEG